LVHGGFEPEQTMQVFNDAIEQALKDGFNGFRAAAEMSWALEISAGAESLIAYETLLRLLFSTSRVTGLCLYDRRRMPLRIVNGALATHPIVELSGKFACNPLYDETVRSLSDVEESSAALARFDRLSRDTEPDRHNPCRDVGVSTAQASKLEGRDHRTHKVK
jgi:MEDS: MEthanogen/methylotroph, DcmR Sensory domain